MIAVQSEDWRDAAKAAGATHTYVNSTAFDHNAQAESVAARLRDGTRHLPVLGHSAPEFILDINAGGLQFVGEPGPGQALPGTLHDRLGVPLVSQFVDPLVTCMRGIPATQYVPLLRSPSWIKLAFDRAMAREFERFGFPNVGYLPMAARDRDYDTRPLDLSAITHAVGFVGGQTSNVFNSGTAFGAAACAAGVLALAARIRDERACFLDTFFDLYGLAPAPSAADDDPTLAAKLQTYTSAKLFASASLWLAQRNAYVMFLARHMGGSFRVIGRNWETLGVKADAPVEGYDAYLTTFRRTLININLQNGNTETGLNLRTFEIAAAGGFLLAGYTPELGECFEIGGECDTFRSERELVEKIEYYASHPQRAAEIAARGQRRVLRDHLYSHRLAQVRALVARPSVRQSTPAAAAA